MDATPIELFTAAIATITAAGVLFLAYDVRALNRKFDRLVVVGRAGWPGVLSPR